MSQSTLTPSTLAPHTLAPHTLAIVVPIHDEARNLPELVRRLNAISDRVAAEFGLSVSHVFVDDGSRDEGFALLRRLDHGGHDVRLLQFSRNFGKEAALSAGIAAAPTADAIVMMDADLQHPPELILDLVRIWKEQGPDSVYTYKEDRHVSEGWLKTLLSNGFYRIINHDSRYDITANAGDFRLINRRFADALGRLPESQRFMKGLYGWVGFRQHGIPMTPPPRKHGQSHFNVLRLFALSFDAMTSFTTAPLRMMALIGFCIAAFSGLYGLFIVIERVFFTSGPVGIASLLVMVAFFGGIQMVFLGVLGEYVGKIVLEAKRRPAYVLAEDLTLPADPPSADTPSADTPPAATGPERQP